MKERTINIANVPEAEKLSEEWLGYLRARIATFDAYDFPTDKNDRERAVWGLIIGDITGDAVNGLLGSLYIIQVDILKYVIPPPDDQKLITQGIAQTWLMCKKTVDEYHDCLPAEVRDNFQDIFDKYGDFVKNIISGNVKDYREVERIGKELYKALRYGIRSSPQIYQDIKFGLSLLHYVQHTKIMKTCGK